MQSQTLFAGKHKTDYQFIQFYPESAKGSIQSAIADDRK